MCDCVHNLLENSEVLQAYVPSHTCSDLFQPLDLSIGKPFEDNLKSKFSDWCVQEPSKQLAAGTQVEEVQVDIQMSVVKELSRRLFISAYDCIRSSPDIVKNGFKMAGITEALGEGSSRGRSRTRSPRPQ